MHDKQVLECTLRRRRGFLKRHFGDFFPGGGPCNHEQFLVVSLRQHAIGVTLGRWDGSWRRERDRLNDLLLSTPRRIAAVCGRHVVPFLVQEATKNISRTAIHLFLANEVRFGIIDSHCALLWRVKEPRISGRRQRLMRRNIKSWRRFLLARRRYGERCVVFSRQSNWPQGCGGSNGRGRPIHSEASRQVVTNLWK